MIFLQRHHFLVGLWVLLQYVCVFNIVYVASGDPFFTKTEKEKRVISTDSTPLCFWACVHTHTHKNRFHTLYIHTYTHPQHTNYLAKGRKTTQHFFNCIYHLYFLFKGPQTQSGYDRYKRWPLVWGSDMPAALEWRLKESQKQGGLIHTCSTQCFEKALWQYTQTHKHRHILTECSQHECIKEYSYARTTSWVWHIQGKENLQGIRKAGCAQTYTNHAEHTHTWTQTVCVRVGVGAQWDLEGNSCIRLH